MVIFSKYAESIFKEGKRILKFAGIGGSATTGKECAPFGFDAQAPAGMTAIYSNSTNDQERVVIGYINKNQLAGAGESRHYAIDKSGAVVSFVHCKSNGNTEINGNQYSAVRWQELNTHVQDLITQVNSQWPLIAAGIATGGGSYTPTNVSVSMASSESKTVKIK